MQQARNFQKYAVYGVHVKVIPKEFFPESSSTENVRAIHCATTTDLNATGSTYTAALYPEQL